ncbi:hypothetical protein PENSPDRAFT_672792 [Peniophora sp. CONT]|nr:hypothetical protein PENSPDRAFT_672792 [Peniophora sp. CONT]
MDYNDDWSILLRGHPIFLPNDDLATGAGTSAAAELSQATLAQNAYPGRRQTMLIKDTELIVAVKKELRVTSLKDAQLSKSMRKTYKVLHTPGLSFEIRQLAINPSGKLLAIAGSHEVAVVVLPRPGYMRLVSTNIDCKSIKVGQPYHGVSTSSPIAKIQWHPWGDSGSTLLVMTADGKLREYDISVDTEEPAQVVSFVPERKRSFNAFDESENEVVSFTLGKGRADWGPLTVYTVMKSGDVYAICPYLPQNASVPSSYLHALDCYVNAKQEYLAKYSSKEVQALSVLYDYQRKYINALLKQLPAGTNFPAPSRTATLHPPQTLKHLPRRQGPFLLQPAPRELPGSNYTDATDIVYLSFGSDGVRDEDNEKERLGLVLIASQDGKVDVCLDVDKVEARWDTSKTDEEWPMLAVYETVDLGLLDLLATQPPSVNLLEANHPVIFPDPIHDDTVYVYHAFGTHSLNFERILKIGDALRGDDDASLLDALEQRPSTDVRHIVSTFSIESMASHPVLAVAIPNDVYLAYSISVLTSAMHIASFSLNMRLESAADPPSKAADKEKESVDFLKPLPGPPAYVPFPGAKPYELPPILSQPVATRFSVDPAHKNKELRITPDTLRYLHQQVERFSSAIRDAQSAYKDALQRREMQLLELTRQTVKMQEIREKVETLKGTRQHETEERVKQLRDSQSALMGRLDAVLQAMMKRANPELTDQEKKWFDELKRMEAEVLGSGGHTSESLRARISQLQREIARLRPQLEAVRSKQTALVRASPEPTSTLGASQVSEFDQHFNKERTRIQKMQKELVNLAKALNHPITRPPSLSNSFSGN